VIEQNDDDKGHTRVESVNPHAARSRPALTALLRISARIVYFTTPSHPQARRRSQNRKDVSQSASGELEPDEAAIVYRLPWSYRED
jgi:acyl-CoA synthetase (AMP-forming)/AMP-acid ligase II